MTFYTDGSAHPNPGPGGYGIVIVDENLNKIVSVYSKQYNTSVTNNQMELEAIVEVMLRYGINIEETGWEEIPIVYTDSNYCHQIFTNWMFGWERRGWIKSDKKVPENLDLIKKYFYHYQKGYRINLRKCKGHAGNKYNELADNLATGKMSIDGFKQLNDFNF